MLCRIVVIVFGALQVFVAAAKRDDGLA